MSVTFTNQEAILLIEFMGRVPLVEFDTPNKKDILARLMNAAQQFGAVECIGEGSGAIFMLQDCTAGTIVNSIKLLRACTGWGLKEAKDAIDKADPNHDGGTLGPFVSSVRTIEQLAANLADYKAKFGTHLVGRLVAA